MSVQQPSVYLLYSGFESEFWPSVQVVSGVYVTREGAVQGMHNEICRLLRDHSPLPDYKDPVVTETTDYFNNCEVRFPDGERHWYWVDEMYVK